MRIPYIRFCVMITAVLLLAGCSPSSKEMVSLITQGQTISIEVTAPTAYEIIQPKGKAIENTGWVQLDQIRNDLSGFRQAFDDVFYINKVTEGDQHGKSGCLYVGTGDVRNGNATLKDACLNKAFHDTYWDNQVKNTKTDLAATSLKAYTDLTGTGEESLYAAFNAYYGLLNDSENPSEFNGTQSVSREQFMAALYKASNPVDDTLTASPEYLTVIADNEYSRLASQIESYAFLNLSNKGLRSHESGKITRAEALYLLMNYIFHEELSAINPKDYKDIRFTDAENAGDLAFTLKFKQKSKNDQGETVITPLERWESYTLAYMTTHPDDGLQEELYKALILANQLGLISTTEDTRWDEPLSKTEAIKFIFQSYMASAKLHGYATEKEHGTMVKTEVPSANQPNSGKELIGTRENGEKMWDYTLNLMGKENFTKSIDSPEGIIERMVYAEQWALTAWNVNQNLPKQIYLYPIDKGLGDKKYESIPNVVFDLFTGDSASNYAKAAREYFGVVRNVSYKDIEKAKKSISYYCDPMVSWEETGVDEWANSIVANEAITEGGIITDSSLVYKSGFGSTRVRGIYFMRLLNGTWADLETGKWYVKLVEGDFYKTKKNLKVDREYAPYICPNELTLTDWVETTPENLIALLKATNTKTNIKDLQY